MTYQEFFKKQESYRHLVKDFINYLADYNFFFGSNEVDIIEIEFGSEDINIKVVTKTKDDLHKSNDYQVSFPVDLLERQPIHQRRFLDSLIKKSQDEFWFKTPECVKRLIKDEYESLLKYGSSNSATNAKFLENRYGQHNLIEAC